MSFLMLLFTQAFAKVSIEDTYVTTKLRGDVSECRNFFEGSKNPADEAACDQALRYEGNQVKNEATADFQSKNPCQKIALVNGGSNGVLLSA
jgi:hypothetical protein